MVEQSAVNRWVAGSSPASGAIFLSKSELPAHSRHARMGEKEAEAGQRSLPLHGFVGLNCRIVRVVVVCLVCRFRHHRFIFVCNASKRSRQHIFNRPGRESDVAGGINGASANIRNLPVCVDLHGIDGPPAPELQFALPWRRLAAGAQLVEQRVRDSRFHRDKNRVEHQAGSDIMKVALALSPECARSTFFPASRLREGQTVHRARPHSSRGMRRPRWRRAIDP
jgi:hypothetical protein